MGSPNRSGAVLWGILLLGCAASASTEAAAPSAAASGATESSERGAEADSAPEPAQVVATAEDDGAGVRSTSAASRDVASPDVASPDSPQPGADDGLDADIAALSASTQTQPGPAAAAPPRAPVAGATQDSGGREIVYRVTPKGLVIEIDGIHLRPEAKPFKEKSGAYGIELVVNAESFDGRRYRVNKPGEGPFSIAGKVEGQAGKAERFADQRVGNGEDSVMAGNPRRFKQRWPGRGQPKLWQGQTVTLEVGLWGVRAESERERPVRRLFVVKMVAGSKSPAVITPPALDWGT